MIYLDNNATTALDPRVAETMLSVWRSGPLNPSSQHAAGRKARVLLDDAVSELGRLLGTRCDQPNGPQLILTSGGTEANNIALTGIGDPHAPLIVSQIEHASVLEVAKAAEKTGRRVDWIPVDASGVISLPTLERILQGDEHLAAGSPRPALVSLMAANNETGVLQPIAAAASLCRAAGVPLHVDATQIVGKLPFSFDQLALDAITFAAHKFHGPAGIGGLLLRESVAFRPAWQGGAQQLGQRPGTEAVALAAGAAAALRLALQTVDATTLDPISEPNASMRRLRDRFESHLLEQIPELVIHGRQTERLPGTSCIGFPGTNRQSMLMALDFAGIACSSGSACASGSSQPSYVLQAMAVADELVDASLRFGLSRFSTEEDIDRSTSVIVKAYKHLRKD
ncbi:MAG: cysteine desulfurase family protein [Pirellulaceae bacterium]